MATITRCDYCKKTSDEQRIGYIGKVFGVKDSKKLLAKIITTNDTCFNCLKEMINQNYTVRYDSNDEDN